MRQLLMLLMVSSMRTSISIGCYYLESGSELNRGGLRRRIRRILDKIWTWVRKKIPARKRPKD